MSISKILGSSVLEHLSQLGYEIIEDTDTKILFGHKDNKSKIIIKQVNGNYILNFKNNNNEKFLKSDWYLGNKDGVCCIDIFTIIEKPEFKNFCECKQDKFFLAINKFFIVSEVEKFEQIIQKHGFMELKFNDDGTIDIINSNVNLTLRLSIDDKFVWLKDLSSGIENCIGEITEEKAEQFEKILCSKIFQLEMGNIRLHKGTEPKLAPEQEQNIVNDLQEEIKKQKSSTQQKIIDLCDKIAHLLVYKNQKYGDSAIHPKNIFYKGDSENSILIRLDDKISRIINNTDGIRTNDIVDIIGYLVLLLIAKNVSLYDIECLKD